MTESQKSQFKETLATYPEIKSIAEIGLNGGHSLALFLSSTPHIEKVVSFDLNQHDYTKVAVEYFSRFYKEQFTFVEGDSKITVPTYTATHPGSTFDLIYIDGDHSYEGCLTDIINCQYLAGEGSRLWIDDYNGVEIQNAVQTCVNSGLLKVLEKHVSENPCGHREWIEARYMR